MQTRTFWQLANQYKIEIPIIQRDYAQGRSDKKSEEIGRKFLSDLLTHLKNNNPIELDFVYGKVHEGVFIPIDGQQRLTTLFLLHWYIATMIGEQELLKNIAFTYKTRVSARDFCEGLTRKGFKLCSNQEDADFIKYVQSKVNENELIDNDYERFRVSYSLQNSPWFFLSWKRDPTVQSMLRMLDAVHEKFEKFKDEEIDGFWKILTAEHYTLPTDNPKLNELVQLIETKGNEETQEKLKEIQEKPAISFKFLNLDEFELADDLY